MQFQMWGRTWLLDSGSSGQGFESPLGAEMRSEALWGENCRLWARNKGGGDLCVCSSHT